MGTVENLEKMLAEGTDNALLRFGLADAYFKRAEYGNAVSHLASAVEQNPDYSAAWKLLGKILSQTGEREEATRAFQRGIAAAERKGDVQAAKEMKVFLKRLTRKA